MLKKLTIILGLTFCIDAATNLEPKTLQIRSPVSVTCLDLNNNTQTPPKKTVSPEEIKISLLSLNKHFIAGIAGHKISVSCNLSEFRVPNMDSLSFLLRELNNKKNVVCLSFMQGTSQKFNILYPTLTAIYNDHLEKNSLIEILFHTNNPRARAHERLEKLPSSRFLSSGIFSTGKTVAITSPGECGPQSGSTDSAEIILPFSSITDFGVEAEKILCRGEIDQIKGKIVWNEDRYGTDPYFGIRDSRAIFETYKIGVEAIQELKARASVSAADIKVVNLSQSIIQDEDLESLIEIVMALPSITILDLSYTPLTQHSSLLLVKLLKKQPSLRLLNVNNTDLFDDYLVEESFPAFLRMCMHEIIEGKSIIEKLIWIEEDERNCLNILNKLKIAEEKFPLKEILDNHVFYANFHLYILKILEEKKYIDSIKYLK